MNNRPEERNYIAVHIVLNLLTLTAMLFAIPVVLTGNWTGIRIVLLWFILTRIYAFLRAWWEELKR
jgi:hypothetical protein